MDLTNHWSFEHLKSEKNQIKKVFFYRVCGTGMGAAACLLKEKGLEIEGGDNKFAPPMSTYLESTGIPLKNLSECNDEYLKSFDLIVVGNVVPRTSDDARRIEQLEVPFCSFPAALGALVLDDVEVIGLAGTHGKTTTTWFLSQMFKNLGEDPGYFVGGVIPGEPSARLGEGKVFFIESDEYDCAYFEKISKFRQYSIDRLILTSLEFDHADIFSSIEDIKDEFRVLLRKLKTPVIFDCSYEAARDLQIEFKNLQWLGYECEDAQGPFITNESPEGTVFNLGWEGQLYEFQTNIVGKHNILNISSGILLAFEMGYPIEEIKNSISSLEMVKRRQEVRGTYNGSIVIDDFAHHPRAVNLTIETIKTKFPGKRIVTIFEANSATARSDIFQEGFTQSLSRADKVFLISPERPTSVQEHGNLDLEKMRHQLEKESTPSNIFKDLHTLREAFKEEADENTLLLVLSNGTCLDLWKSDFVQELS